jgi:maltose/moltooligosaccharide transporter
LKDFDTNSLTKIKGKILIIFTLTLLLFCRLWISHFKDEMPMSKLQKSISLPFYLLLSLPSTAMGFGLSVQISALSWILSTKYHLAIDEVGFVWLAGPVAGIVGQLLAGIISDKIWFLGGRRRPLIIIGGIVAAGMLFMLPRLDLISNTLGMADIMFVALTVALGLDLAINVGFNPTRAIIADMTPEGEARTKGYTIMQTVSGFFGVSAYFIALVWGKENLIYIGMAVMLSFNLLPVFFIQEPRSLAPNKVTTSAQNSTNLTQLTFIYLANAFTWLGVQTMFVYLYAYLKGKMGITDEKEMGQIIDVSFLILNTVGFVLPALILAPITKRVGRVRVHAAAIAVMSLSYFSILGLSSSPVTLYIVMGLLGIGWAAVVSLPFAIASEYVSSDKMGLYMGIFNLSVVIPQLVVSAVFGRIFKNAENLDIIFVICGVSLGISALLWAFAVKDKRVMVQA